MPYIPVHPSRPPIGGNSPGLASGVKNALTLFSCRLGISTAATKARMAVTAPDSFRQNGRYLLKRAEEHAMSTKDRNVKIVLSVIFVLVGGLLSGLTLGIMGLDSTNLRVLSSSGSPQQQRDAKTVLNLLSKGRHWVLVSLLLGNVIVNETLPVFLDSLTGGGGLVAIASSTALIVIFGEIIPQAVCSHAGLAIGAKCARVVQALMYLEAPVAWPIAKLLDSLLGSQHGTLYRKIELKTLVGLHGQLGENSLSEDEVTIISAVLDLSDKSLSQIMTPLEDCYTLSTSTILDEAKVDEIVALGHSRIPVHTESDVNEFVGMLIVKNIIAYDPEDAKPVSSFTLLPLPQARPDASCLDALNYFLQGKSHMVLVTSPPDQLGPGAPLGLVSLEDVIEELLGREIIDETDIYVDMHKKNPVHRLGHGGNGGTSRTSLSSLTGGLAPLLRGVVERRSARRDSMNGSPGPWPGSRRRSGETSKYPPPAVGMVNLNSTGPSNKAGGGFLGSSLVHYLSGGNKAANGIGGGGGGGHNGGVGGIGVDSPTVAENETLLMRHRSSVTPLLGDEGEYQYSDDDEDGHDEKPSRGRIGG